MLGSLHGADTAHGYILPSQVSPLQFLGLVKAWGWTRHPQDPSLPARTVNSSPRSHNVRAAGAGLPGPAPPSPGGVRLGTAGPDPCFRVGGPRPPLSVFLSPEFPLEARGHACLGTPALCLSICLSLCCCPSLAVLACVLTVNVDGPILDVP